MSHNFYIILHLASLIGLALSLGGLWSLSFSGEKARSKTRSILLAFHGLLMFLILLAGFGLIVKIKLPFPWPFWIYIKLFVWLALGVAPVFIRKLGERPASFSKQLYSFLALFGLMLLALLSARLKF